MSGSSENMKQLNQILQALKPKHTQLVAVSKTQAIERILTVYETGHKTFGENKALELRDKQATLPKDINWHFIGHLQTNKVKYIAPFVQLIHSVDSLKLLVEIDKQARKNDRVIDCLLQFHIAEEAAKYGLTVAEAEILLTSKQFATLKNIRIVGVMGMATFTHQEAQIRSEFKQLKQIFLQLQTSFFKGQDTFKELSMGMSGDYLIAVEEGSTMVRIGSLIFNNK